MVGIDINEHPAAHTGLFLATIVSSAITHFTKNEIAADITIVLGLCGIANYLVTWSNKLYIYYKGRKKP
jgi:hypothetical protein